MKEILTVLNNNHGVISLVFSFLVMISTIVYAVLTALLVKETICMREVQTEPKIQITPESFEFAVNFVKLNIKNIGNGPAFDLVISSSVEDGGSVAEKILQDFSSVKAFSNGISYLGPNQSFNSHFTRFGENIEDYLKAVIKINIQYRSITKKRYKETIFIRLNELEGLYQFGKTNLYSIADSLEKIQHDINWITTGFKKIKIDIYDNKDRMNERKREEEMIENYRKEKGLDL